jgi:endonuclease YncB( thermonuclease family)
MLSEKIMNKMVNIKVLKTDKYGRYLAEVSYKKLNINNWLLKNNYALLYDGGAKRSFDSNKFNPELSEDVAVAMSLTPENPNYHNFNNNAAGSLVKIDINIEDDDKVGIFKI